MMRGTSFWVMDNTVAVTQKESLRRAVSKRLSVASGRIMLVGGFSILLGIGIIRIS